MRISKWMGLIFSLLMLLFLSAAILPISNPTVSSYMQPIAGDPAIGTPICLDRSNIPNEELHWLYMPSTPGELATREYYGYLAGELIRSGVVNASECPLNGLWGNGYANSCGLEKTREASIYLQNVFDDEILAAGKAFGVPPVMLKQLIRYESQFWPIKIGFYHFGLGHLTYLGAQNALIWSRDLYESVAARSSGAHGDLGSELLTLMDASCPTCPYKIDIPKAEQSVTYLAQTLLGVCKQTSQVVANATDKNAGEVVSYPTIWKLTLLNYNAGPMCVYDAVRASYHASKPSTGQTISWVSIVNHLGNHNCQLGLKYVDGITGRYYQFKPTP